MAYFNEDQFSKALPLFEELVKIDTENPAFNFYTGYCMQMLNLGADNLLPYYEKAVVETTLEFESKYSERRAPVIALKYLAQTYQYLYRFDDALEYFILYKNAISKSKENTKKIIKEINEEIEKCYNAKKNVLTQLEDNGTQKKFLKTDSVSENMQSSSLSTKEQVSAIFQAHALPRSLRKMNTGSSEFAAQMLSAHQIVFTSNRPDSIINSKIPEGMVSSNIFYIEKENEVWSEPKLMKNVNTEASEVFGSLSPDGKTLYIASDFKGDYDVYICRKKNENKWSKPIKPGKGINTSKSETSPFVTADGQKLFFCSDREGGQGGSDIFMCNALADGSWSKPLNLGNIINSNWDEESPFFDNENNILYFSSKGHNSLGGFDIFYSKYQNNIWSKPVNIGLPINSVYDDLYFKLPYKGNLTIYTSNRSKNPNDFDIMAIENFDAEDFISIDTSHAEKVTVDENTSIEKLDSMLSEVKKMDEPISYWGCVLDYESKPLTANIQILEAKSNVLVAKPVPDAEGKFIVTLEPRKDYTMWVTAPQYIKEPEMVLLDLKSTIRGKYIYSYIGMNPDKRISRTLPTKDTLIAGFTEDKIVKEEVKNTKVDTLISKEISHPINDKIIADNTVKKENQLTVENKIENRKNDNIEKNATKDVIDRNIKPDFSNNMNKKPCKGKYTIQLAASNHSADNNFTDLDVIYKSKGNDNIWRYYIGAFENKDEAVLFKNDLLKSGVEKAFVTMVNEKDIEIVALLRGNINNNTDNSSGGGMWTVQLGAGKMQFVYFKKFSDVKVCDGKDNMRRFIIGEFTSKKEAIALKNEAIKKGYYDAWTPRIDENRQFCNDLETIEENEKIRKNGSVQAALSVDKYITKGKKNGNQRANSVFKNGFWDDSNFNYLADCKKNKKKHLFNLWGLLANL